MPITILVEIDESAHSGKTINSIRSTRPYTTKEVLITAYYLALIDIGSNENFFNDEQQETLFVRGCDALNDLLKDDEENDMSGAICPRCGGYTRYVPDFWDSRSAVIMCICLYPDEKKDQQPLYDIEKMRMRSVLQDIIENCLAGETKDVSYHDRLRIILGLAKYALE